MTLSHEENRRVIVRGLIELFWDTTNTLHMPLFEMMVTPLDFSMLTGVLFGGDDVIYDRNFGNDIEVLRDMYGELASEFLAGESRNVSYSVFSTVFDNDKLLSVLSPDQLARCLLTYLLSSTIFAYKSNKTWFHYLPCLRDLRRMGEYNWGGAGYANFMQHLRRACRVNDPSNFEHYSQVTIGGLWNILEVWFYEYFPAYSPSSTKRIFPAACRLSKRYHKVLDICDPFRVTDLNSVRDAINIVTADSVCLSPWADSTWVGTDIPSRVQLARDLVGHRVRTRVTLPSARIKVMGPNGEDTYVDIPEASDPIEGLPFPPDFKGFDRTDSEKLWRLLHSSLKRVAELTTFVNLWSSIPKVSFVGPNPLLAAGSAAGSVDIPSRLSELERMFSLSSDSRLNVHDVRGASREASNEGPRSRGVLRKRRAIIESDSDDDLSRDFRDYLGFTNGVEGILVGRNVDLCRLIAHFTSPSYPRTVIDFRYRKRALVLCLLNRYLFVSSSTTMGHGCLLMVAKQMRNDCSPVPLILAETLHCLDAVFRDPEASFSGSPLLLQVWLQERMRLIERSLDPMCYQAKNFAARRRIIKGEQSLGCWRDFMSTPLPSAGLFHGGVSRR